MLDVLVLALVGFFECSLACTVQRPHVPVYTAHLSCIKSRVSRDHVSENNLAPGKSRLSVLVRVDTRFKSLHPMYKQSRICHRASTRTALHHSTRTAAVPIRRRSSHGTLPHTDEDPLSGLHLIQTTPTQAKLWTRLNMGQIETDKSETVRVCGCVEPRL